MRIIFKITEQLLNETKENLRRPHPFAAERVGFFMCRVALIAHDALLVLAHGFHGVADDDYLDDATAGATMGPAAIRKALQVAYNQRASMFHVHIHEHRGKPRFSSIDAKETVRFVPDFWHVQADLPHGAIVLSEDSAFGRCWLPGLNLSADITTFTLVGVPMRRL